MTVWDTVLLIDMCHLVRPCPIAPGPTVIFRITYVTQAP